MVDLVQYLRDRYDEDKHDAQRLKNSRHGAAIVPVGDGDPIVIGGQWMLDDAASKRKILDELLPDMKHADQCIEGEWGSNDDLATRIVELLLLPYGKCGARTVFWPEEDACDAACTWPPKHGGTRHLDETLGSWDENEMPTSYPSGSQR